MNVNTSSLSKHRAGGFTLVELLVVVSIMLLMLKLILPSLKGLMGGTDASMARSQLIGDLNSARTLALRNGSDVYVVFMPLLNSTDIFQGDADARGYLKGEGNFMLAEQSISYAIYSKKGQYSPYDWYSDWKRLPQGFYFGGKDLISIWNSAGIPATNRLSVPNLKTGHSRGNGFVDRKIYLPYLKYNAKGELSSGENSGRMAMRDFYLSIREGGVLPPAKDANGTYAYEAAERDEPSVAANKKSVWLQVNGLSGRADALERVPAADQSYSVWVHTFKGDEKVVGSKMSILPGYDSSWAQPGMWGGINSAGNRVFLNLGNSSRIRAMAYHELPRDKVITLIAHIRRESPGTVLQYRRNPNQSE